MDANMINTLGTLVGTLGFPIVCCGALFWYMTKQAALHAKESKEMQQAIADLKIAITELTDHLKKED